MTRRENRIRRSVFSRELAAIFLVLFTPALVVAQAELATFRGTVVDAEGNPVEGAVIRLTDTVRGGEIELDTNDDGRFYRRNLRPSEYALTVEKEGYVSYEEALSFRAGEEKRQEVRLLAAISAPEAAFAKGIEAFNSGDFEAAAAAFEEVTKLSPETPEGHTNLALAYIQLGKMEPAVQELEKAAELSADSFRTWAQLAMAYIQVDRLQAAMRAFETALSKDHDPADPMAVESWMTLGALNFAENNVEQAVKAYEKALAADPDSSPALLALGKCHFNLGNMDEARGYFERVVSVDADPAAEEEAQTFLEEIEKRSGPDSP